MSINTYIENSKAATHYTRPSSWTQEERDEMIKSIAEKIVSTVDIKEIVLTTFIKEFKRAHDKEPNHDVKKRLALELSCYEQSLKEHLSVSIKQNTKNKDSGKKIYLVWACTTLLCIGLFFFVRQLI